MNKYFLTEQDARSAAYAAMPDVVRHEQILPYRTRHSEAVAYKPYKLYALVPKNTPPFMAIRDVRQRRIRLRRKFGTNNFYTTAETHRTLGRGGS